MNSIPDKMTIKHDTALGSAIVIDSIAHQILNNTKPDGTEIESDADGYAIAILFKLISYVPRANCSFRWAAIKETKITNFHAN